MGNSKKTAEVDESKITRVSWETDEEDINVSVEEISNGWLVSKNVYKKGKKFDKLEWSERETNTKYYSKEKPEIMRDVNLDDFVL